MGMMTFLSHDDNEKQTHYFMAPEHQVEDSNNPSPIFIINDVCS